MLNDTQIRNLKPKEKLYRVTDALRLSIEINPNGTKIWRFIFRWEGKYSMLSLGHYPDTSLREARQLRDEYKQALRNGIHPQLHKSKRNGSTNQKQSTFQEVYEMWYGNQKDGWTYDYAIDTQQRVAKHLLPLLGHMPITEINTKMMRDLLLGIQDKGTIDMLYKIKSIASRIFSYSIGMELSEINPVSNLSNDIFKKKVEKHYASITEPKKIKWLLTILKDLNSSMPVRIALDLAPHLLLRPEELAGLEWSEIDFKDRIIRIPAQRMKVKKKAHLIPMSNHVIEVLTMLRNENLNSTYCFPSARSKKRHITADSLRIAIRSAGIDKETFTTHGFRHMGSTRLHELGYNKDVIESQLAHEIGGVRGIYNQAEYLEDRKVMMENWSQWLVNLLAE
jgi:integrase